MYPTARARHRARQTQHQWGQFTGSVDSWPTNGIGRGWVVSIIVPAYTGEFEYITSYTDVVQGIVCGYVSLVSHTHFPTSIIVNK